MRQDDAPPALCHPFQNTFFNPLGEKLYFNPVAGFCFRQVHTPQIAAKGGWGREIVELDLLKFLCNPPRFQVDAKAGRFRIELHFFQQLTQGFLARRTLFGHSRDATFGSYLRHPLAEGPHRNQARIARDSADHSGIARRHSFLPGCVSADSREDQNCRPDGKDRR